MPPVPAEGYPGRQDGGDRDLSGYIVQEGKKLGLDLPVSSKMYDGLKKAGKDRTENE